MRKLNKFFFYLGLFTINAFRYNWKAIVFPTLIVGTIMSLLFYDARLFIPAFIGGYLAQIHSEYTDYKKVANGEN